MLTMLEQPQGDSLRRLPCGGDSLGPFGGVPGAPRTGLRLALLQIGTKLLGEPRLAVVLRRIAGSVVPHSPLPRPGRNQAAIDMRTDLWPWHGQRAHSLPTCTVEWVM